MDTKKRILIVGGVAGGASAATRLRRLCEHCEIILFDKGDFVSFANCGLPYFVGNVIEDEASLIVASPDLFHELFNISVFIQHQVIQINPDLKTIQVKNLNEGSIREESFDALLLSTGAKPICPPLPGIDLPGIYVLRTIPDSHKIRVAAKNAQRAVIIGGGFIGLEMAENLANLGLSVTVFEMANQIMPPLDTEMAVYVEQCLLKNGVQLKLGTGVESFSLSKNGITVHFAKNNTLETDIVLLAIGVQPESTLAEQAGLELGVRNAIKVSDSMQTSHPSIWAVGDVVEVKDVVTGQPLNLPLAGPANRQGRIAASAIHDTLNKKKSRNLSFRGVQGTAVCQIFDQTVAMTGASEKTLQRSGYKNYQVVYLHPGHHVSYFPGAHPIHLKLIFSTENGLVLGAQAIGKAGIARRIDVIAMAIQMQASVYDLEESELCYAPQFGAAKDPVNMAGMIASNFLRKDLNLADWSLLDEKSHVILDVRHKHEYLESHIPGAINIPLDQLRERYTELNINKEIWLICGVGQRAYYATRLLLQKGLKVKVLSGGMQTYHVISNHGISNYY